MNRQESIKTLQTIVNRIAQKYGYTEMVAGQDKQKGIWDEAFTNFLEEKYGDCSTEIKWFKPGDDYSYVEFRFRFSNPVIAIKFRDDQKRETLASLEFSDHRYIDKTEVSVPVELTEVMMWNPGVAKTYLDEMESMWNEVNQ